MGDGGKKEGEQERGSGWVGRGTNYKRGVEGGDLREKRGTSIPNGKRRAVPDIMRVQATNKGLMCISVQRWREGVCVYG